MTASCCEIITARLAGTAQLTGPACLGIDGRTGAGKSTLAVQVADHLSSRGINTAIIPLDLLCYGWDDLAGGVERAAYLLRGFPGPLRWRPYDWPRGQIGEPTVTRCELLIIEGCGAISDPLRPYLTLAVWLEADDGVREARIRARDDYDWAAERIEWERQHNVLPYAAGSGRLAADVSCSPEV